MMNRTQKIAYHQEQAEANLKLARAAATHARSVQLLNIVSMHRRYAKQLLASSEG